jgi:RNA polymerase sigma-70 factor (family 1)
MTEYGAYTDQELINLLKLADMPAFNQIYSRYSGPLYKFAHSILKNEEECDDVLQNVFTWLWEHRESIRITSLQAYLYAAVKFNLAGVIRISNRRTEILAAAPVLQEAVEDDGLELKELVALVRSFTQLLPDRAKQIFEMSRNEYLTNKEIAQRLGISEKTVENQMNISLKKLKAHLGRLSFWSLLI